MNEFEESLRSLRHRPLPPAWRREILAACEKPVAARWRDWLWPSPIAWGALAAIWVGLIVWHFEMPTPASGSSSIAKQGRTPVGPVLSWAEEWQNFLAQNR